MNKLGTLVKIISIIGIAVFISVGLCVVFGLHNIDYPETNIVNAAENSNVTLIENAPYSGIYDFKDPETGIHYIIVAKSSDVAITPRLDKNGNVMKD